MGRLCFMQEVLGDQWQQLPESLKAHHQIQDNRDVGRLSVDYPYFMKPILYLLGLVGILVARRCELIPTTGKKRIRGRNQIWIRLVYLSVSQPVRFRSVWVQGGEGKLIEYVTPFFGLCIAVHVKDGMLFYQGMYYVLNLGFARLPIPEWFILGHTTIVERAIDEDHFNMDFRLTHPLFGQVFRYTGIFRTESG